MNKQLIAKVCLALPIAAFILTGCASTAKTGSAAPGAEPAKTEAAAPAPVATLPEDWKIFQCDVQPDQTPPGFTVTNLKGMAAKTEVIDDAENAGNKLIQITSPAGEDNKLCWSMDMNFDPAVGATIIFRAKAAELKPEALIFDFEIRDGMSRDRFLGKGSGALSLEKAGAKGTFDPKVWHVFRIAFKSVDGALNFTVYMDENPTPILKGKSMEAGENKLFRFGDGSGKDYVSGLYDWVVWNTKGAYGPEAALPEGLLK